MAARVKVVSHRQYSVFFLVCPLFALLSCSDPARRQTIRGTLALCAESLESNDAFQFFNNLDERSRYAMGATVEARREARELIAKDYPEPERTKALAALGPASQVQTAAALFALRCDAACLRGFADQIGAPASEIRAGDEVVVKTTRGGTLHMHAGHDGQYGIVWNTQALSEERSRASRELTQIRINAEIYRQRRALAAKH
jgi:hypothetical protein